MKIFKASAVVVAIFAMSACSDNDALPEEDRVTETRMDEVEVIDGTISDDMVDVDTEKSGDQPADGEKAEAEDQSEDESTSEDSSE